MSLALIVVWAPILWLIVTIFLGYLPDHSLAMDMKNPSALEGALGCSTNEWVKQ